MSRYPISKCLHFMWFQGFSVAPNYLVGTPEAWRMLNPNYEILRWDFDNTSKFIRDNYPRFYGTWNELGPIIKKCDLARLLITYHFGGIYLDCDLIPFTPLENMFGSKVRYCNKVGFTRTLPNPHPQEAYDFNGYDLILSREHRPIDTAGFGVANGVLIAKPKAEFLMEFLESRYKDTRAMVLDYLGPHALTRLLRSRASRLHGKVSVIAPYYFLWENGAMDHGAPHWSVSRHLAMNHWGDKSKPDWWRTG